MGSETITFRPTKLYWIIFLMVLAIISLAAIKGSDGPHEKFVFMTVASTVISIIFSYIALLQMSYSIVLTDDRIRYSRFIKVGDELFYSEIKSIALITGSKGESILKLAGTYDLECKLSGLSRKQQVELLKQLIQKTPHATANHLAINVSKQQFTELNKDVNKKVLWFAIPVILAVILKIIF